MRNRRSRRTKLTMNKYKIEITQSQKYIIDVKAKTEDNAKKQATKIWNKLCATGTYHLHEHGDAETEFTNTYDVTGTDDAN